jgi:hypothetical protein
MAYYVRVNIARPGTFYLKEDGSIVPSLLGHMWLTLVNDQTGQEFNYGFHPPEAGLFSPGPGLIRDDDWRYQSITYQITLSVSAQQFDDLYYICQTAKDNSTFGNYDLIPFNLNVCPDFTF